jgi:serine/threonine protein kinase
LFSHSQRGDIKVFDFGLVKVLKDDMRNADGTYRLTESTGSPRYMAPEIANGLPYNQSCDVYSFGILLWQMLSCEEPFSLYAPRQLRDSVYNKPHKRPHIESDWPEAVQQLLPQMWAASLHDRLTMKAVQSALKDEVVRCRGGKDVDLDFERRRSTFVFEQQTSSA